MNELERFWSKVQRRSEAECWAWLASCEVEGYGVFHLQGGRKTRAHRYALQLRLGRPIAPGAMACHECHNAWCVNPNHLYEGTHRTNSDDKVRASRQMRGSRSAASRLTELQVTQIVSSYRAGGVSQRRLGAMYGVSQSEISRMVNGRSWKHVTQETA